MVHNSRFGVGHTLRVLCLHALVIYLGFCLAEVGWNEFSEWGKGPLGRIILSPMPGSGIGIGGGGDDGDGDGDGDDYSDGYGGGGGGGDGDEDWDVGGIDNPGVNSLQTDTERWVH